MAIAFARIEFVSRSTGASACNSSAYNSRSIIVDERTGEVFNYTKRGGNVYHEVLLPDHVDKKFKDITILSNEVERMERKDNSQLYAEFLLALDKDLDPNDPMTIEIYKAQIYKYIELKGWIKEGLGVQIDIHKPDGGNNNWHCHGLVTTRRFLDTGLGFETKKARDIWPQIRNNLVIDKEEFDNGVMWRDVQNDDYKARGMPNRVDLPGELTQEHIGPVRMRSVLNQAVERNEDRRIASIEHLNSGQRLLEKVTHHMSVFNVGDLKRAVKFIPNGEARERLVEDALASKSLLELHDEQGKNTGYYTTVEIREEEEKLLRLSSYVASGKNVIAMGGLKAVDNANRLIESVPGSFSSEQKLALSHLLMDESGVRIVRGRAGTGKSHVLGQVATIAKSCGVNVIGLAPTHKAREELAKKPDFDQNDTVKGMLFKLRHGRFELPKYSLLVVDEAGMVGNEDYHELMRVAATRKCNVILAGDERQLASVQRGGMYEVYASSYGSTTLLDIQRQKSDWGKSVAMAFSRGEVATGVGILQAQNRLLVASNANESMQNLLSHWSKSEEKIADRLIIAVKNKDVDALNHGARQYLKVEGVLSGEEIAVGGHHYMQGDRILIKQTNKELGLTNGDLAQLVAVSKDKFVLRLENEDKSSKDNKEISFSPSSYSGFRHGYATTVFKAQGASIRDVFVFHDGLAGVRNSYVALSRHVNELKLYINNQSTISTAHLVKQLSHDPEIGSSLSYLTKADLAKQELNNEYEKNKGFLGRMVEGAVDFTAKQLITLADKYLPKSEYYEYKPPQVVPERVEAVLDAIGADMMMGQEEASTVIHVQEKIAVGENVMSANNINNIQVKTEGSVYNPGHIANVDTVLSVNKSSQSTKQRFYANADYARNAAKNLQRKTVWDNESEQLRNVVRFKAEQIARDLLGEPNKKLSDGRTLRFGENGKIAVRISGERMGTWYDFSSSTGGDIFALVQEKQACDFKAAAEYLRRECGLQSLNSGGSLKLVHDHNNSDLTEKYIKERQAEERSAKAKQMFVTNLHDRAKDIGDRSVAHRYLTQRRGISCAVGEDIKTTGIKGQNQYLPAIVAFARNEQGVITGGQQILLDKRTGGKADVDIAKRSFGKIAGSFVEVGKVQNTPNGKVNVTIIAEGLETALSVKQALANDPNNKEIQVKVLCSLGISNIKNYQAVAGEKIIIAADNDGQHAVTSKTIDTAQEELQSKGALVEIVRPEKPGDFNDVLQQNTNGEGEKEIQNAFKGAMTRITETALHQVRINGEFDELNKEKAQAKTFEELLPLLVKEQQLAHKLAKESPAIFDKLAERKLNTDPQVTESLVRERSFLVKHDIVPEKNLFKTVQKSNDIALTAKNMFNDCQRHAQSTSHLDEARVDTCDKLGKEEDTIKLLKNNKIKYQELAPYLKDTVERRPLEHLTNRLKVYEIAEEHSHKHPEQSQEFKEEMQSLYRFSKLGMEAALKTYEQQGLEKAVSVAKETNIERVLSHLGSQSDILNSRDKLKGEAYIAEASKDKIIMKYVDAALSKGRVFDRSFVKNNDLLDYANQRDVNKTLEEFKGNPPERQLFKENIDNLQRFGQSKELRDGLTLFKDKGINALVRHTDTACTNNVQAGIRKDLINIYKNQPVEFLDGRYREKSDYLAAIGKDENVMKYIAPKSDIGQEIEKQRQVVQTQQVKGHDFDREK
jgi:Ti-type conjugative transfer relaxase TraA